MWFIYALSSAVLLSFRKVGEKKLSHVVHHLHLAWMVNLASLPVLALLAFVFGEFFPKSALSTDFWTSLIISICVTAPINAMVYLQSLKYGELSRVAPL